MNLVDTQRTRIRAPADSVYTRVLTRPINTPVAMLVTAAVMLALAFVVNALNVPNPNMILVTGLVICSSLFGYTGGIVAAIIMLGYTLSFFSTGHDFMTFTEQNFQKVVISAVGIVVITFFVSTLRLAVSRSFVELERLNGILEEDNQLLEEASTVDSLTKTRNRFALRRDFPSYVDKNLHVMMMDIDNFKAANDTYGHHAGDLVLKKMGGSLVELFEQDHVYRYGGDEFLVIYPGAGNDEFAHALAQLEERIGNICIEGTDKPIHFSGGYVYGTPELQSDLRYMVRQADDNLYVSKGQGKNRVTGCAFSLADAEHLEPRTGATGRIDNVPNIT